MKKILLFLVLIFFLVNLLANDLRVDSLEIRLENVTDKEKIEILNNLAGAYWELPPNERIEFAEEAVKLSEKYGNQKSKAIAFGHLGVANNNLGNTHESLDYFIRALKIMEQINDKNGIANCYVNLGQANFYMENYDKALEYFEKAYTVREEIADNWGMSQSLIHIGNIKARTQKFDEALDFYFKALKMKKEINDKIGISQIYNNIGNVYLATGKMEKVLEYRFKSLEIDRQLNNKWEISLTTFNIAEYYLTNKEPQKAYPYILESKKLATDIDNQGLINDNIFALSLYYELIGDYKKSLEYQKEYAKITKSQFSSELSDKVAEMQIKYESEKKEKEKQAYKLQLEKSNSHKLKLILGLIIALLIIFFIYYRYRIKKKSNLLLEDLVAKRTLELQKNIEELKETEETLKKAIAKAKETDSLKTAFMNTISHELRTPLNAVIGFSEIISKDTPIDEILDYSKTINNSGIHLLRIVEDMFDISLIETGEIKIQKEEFNISAFLDDIHEKLKAEQEETDKQHIDIYFNPAEKGKDFFVFTDKSKLKKILINLLKNALKFTHEGNIEYGYMKELQQEKPILKFYVKDTGIGIPENKLDIIFENFRQADDTYTRKYEGTGVGLSVAKKLTELLGGKIWIDTEEGKGSTFYFTLPYYKPEKN